MTSGAQLSEQYTLLEKLGTGSFGVVYKAIHKETKQIVAIKQIDLEDSDDDISEIQQEISHLAQCDSEWVTRYYGSFVKGYKLWIGESLIVGWNGFGEWRKGNHLLSLAGLLDSLILGRPLSPARNIFIETLRY